MGQGVIKERSLTIHADSEVAALWQVLGASIRETFSGTDSLVELRNISGSPQKVPFFYAEYFDHAGRLCFSLIIGPTDRGLGERSIEPNQVLRLGSGAVGLFPALEPEVLKLHLLRQESVSPGANGIDLPDGVRAPVTLGGGVKPEATKFSLNLSLPEAKAPLVDLVFAKISVDKQGVPTKVEVLNAFSNQVLDWFQEFAKHQLTYYPATEGPTLRADEVLLLVRITLPVNRSENTLPPVANSPWVQAYLKSVTANDIPPITQVVLQQPPTRVKRNGSTEWTERTASPPGVFELANIGSEWSSPAVGMVNDPSMPHHVRREITKAQPQ
jgi:hypothetical protein